MGTLYDCLREVHLERYYSSFLTHGISKAESLVKLTPRDYGAFGLNTTDERRRLYELINLLRSIFNSSSHATTVPRQKLEHKRSHSFCGNPKRTAAVSRSSTPPPPPPSSPSHSTSPSTVIVPSALEQSLKEARSQHASVVVASRKHFSNTDFLSTKVVENHDFNYSANLSDSSGSSPQSPIEKVTHHTSYNYGIPKNKKKVRASSPRSMRDEKIKVCVRKRPLKGKSEMDVVEVKDGNTVIINEMKLAVDLSSYILQHKFYFDVAFGQDSSNEEVYQKVGKPLVEWLFEKGQATIFTYGQTGAGKTFTMMGSEDIPGLYLLAATDIFSVINNNTYGSGFHVWLSYYEIYCSQLFDLLNGRKRLFAREDGSHKVCIAGLTETEVPDVSSLMQILDIGSACRSKGSTGANPDSSRSHAVLQLQVRDGYDEYFGRISFIDLAGNERAADVKDSDKQSRKEGAEINQSLLALKECIRSLDQESSFTPFRQSKLTHILKDSFIGKSKTCMIANITPSQSSTECTLNTLRYANRVKEIRPESSSTRVMRKKSVDANPGKNTHTMAGTSPCIFHPSNIVCSSTPIRRQCSEIISSEPPRATESPIFFDPNESPGHGHRIPHKVRSRFNILPDKITISKCVPPQDNSTVAQILDRSFSSDIEFEDLLEENSGKNSKVKNLNEYSENELLTSDFNYDLNDLNKSAEYENSNMKCEHDGDQQIQLLELKWKNSDIASSFTSQNVVTPVARTRNHSDPGVSSTQLNTLDGGKMKRPFSSDFIHCSTEENSDEGVDCEYWFGSPKEIQRFESALRFDMAQNEEFDLSSITHMKTVFPLPPTLKTKFCDNNKRMTLKKDQESVRKNNAFCKNSVKKVQLVNIKQTEINCFGDSREDSLQKKTNLLASNRNKSSDAADQDFQTPSSDDRKTNYVNSCMISFNVPCTVSNTAVPVIPSQSDDSICTFDSPVDSSTPTKYLEMLTASKSSLAKELDSHTTNDALVYSFCSQDGEKVEEYFLCSEPKSSCVAIESNSNTINSADNPCSQTNLHNIKDGSDKCSVSTSQVAENKEELCNKSQTMLKQNSCQVIPKTSGDSLFSQNGSITDVCCCTSETDSSLLLPRQHKSDLEVVTIDTSLSENKACANIYSEANSSAQTVLTSVSKKRPKAAFSPSNSQPVLDFTSCKTNGSCSSQTTLPAPVLPSGSSVSRSGQEIIHNEIHNHLIHCHEKQLATMTMLCKQEMKLLLQVKAGQKNFSDFLHKVNQILTQKLKAISTFQQEIFIRGGKNLLSSGQSDRTSIWDGASDQSN
ncbi:KIN-7M, chloroplastic [Octopus vulgaris]|uniref:KIN-7M, chloroplastic n=2 Tax=Octopus vulgaris TaxID=6645 RepID=A0AA36EZ89_OCTVU|nr:KIN-7M, chloroplastic [Octopus vulgaris]